jgi:hypothetical protein
MIEITNKISGIISMISYCLLEANSLLAGIIMNSLIKTITTFGMRKCKFYWNYIVQGY